MEKHLTNWQPYSPDDDAPFPYTQVLEDKAEAGFSLLGQFLHEIKTERDVWWLLWSPVYARPVLHMPDENTLHEA